MRQLRRRQSVSHWVCSCKKVKGLHCNRKHCSRWIKQRSRRDLFPSLRSLELQQTNLLLWREKVEKSLMGSFDLPLLRWFLFAHSCLDYWQSTHKISCSSFSFLLQFLTDFLRFRVSISGKFSICVFLPWLAVGLGDICDSEEPFFLRILFLS